MRPSITAAPDISPVRPLPDSDMTYVVGQNIEIMVGRTVRISVTATGRPAPGITWRLPSGRRIHSGRSEGRFSVTDDGTLVIRDVKLGDEGKYRAIAKNIAGLAKVKSQLRVFGQYTWSVYLTCMTQWVVICRLSFSANVIG